MSRSASAVRIGAGIVRVARVGRMVTELHTDGLAGNTVIILSAKHGQSGRTLPR